MLVAPLRLGSLSVATGGLSAERRRYPDSKEEVSECDLVPTPTGSDLWLEIHSDTWR